MAQHVFISYAHEDDIFARELKQQIENAGHDQWFDRDKLKGSQNWVEECQKAIDDSYALIVIKSPASYESPYVTSEWSYAMGRDVPIIPLLYIPQNPPHTWLEINAIQHLDFSAASHQSWDNLFELLHEKRIEFGSRVRVPKDLPPAVRAGLRALNSEFPSDVIKGTERLGNLKHVGAVAGLITTLGHEDNETRNAALAAIVKIGEPAVPQLLNDFLIYEGDTRWMIANALSQIGSEAAFQGLISALNDPRGDVRKAAAQYLRNFKDARAIKPLLSAFRDEDKDIRSTAIGTLIEIGSLECVPYLVEALQDVDKDVRSGAAGGIGIILEGKSVDGAIIEALLNALHDPEFYVRMFTAQSLGRIADPRAIDGLFNLSKHENISVRQAGLDALNAIKTEEAAEAVKRWPSGRNW